MMKLIRFIPNMLTLTNAALGVLGMIFISKEQVTWAVYCLAIALVFDFLDGFLARLLNAQSELGKQLDSLADMITFGALPGFIVFQMIAVSRGIYFEEIYLWSFTDILVCSSGLLITAGATLRLGVFNLDTESRDYFIGIPTPAIAIFVISIPIILEIHYKLNFYNPISDTMIATLGEIRHWTALDRALVSMLFSTKFYVILSFILLFLMNMKVPMLALKLKGLSWAKKQMEIRSADLGADFIPHFLNSVLKLHSV